MTSSEQRRPQNLVRRMAAVVLAMNGIVPGRMTPLRWLSIGGSYAAYYLLLVPRATPAAAWWYFGAATALHYAWLFAMFRPGGWSRTLRTRYGDERGYLLHEAGMAFLFCHNALSIGFLCWVTRGSALAGVALPAAAAPGMIAAAAAGILLGLITKVWATLVVGLDAYYYRDMFLERPGGALEQRGPYRVLRNPMYTVGHLQAYGAAFFYGSAPGLAAAAANQALVLLFNAAVEQPHVRRLHRHAAGR